MRKNRIWNDRAILTLSVTQTLVWGGLFYVFPASLLRWETALGWTRAELTLAMTLATLASACTAPLVGRLIDRGHGPTLMGLAPILGGLALMLMAQVSALWQFYVLWLFIGVMQAGSLYEPCFALVTHARGGNAKSGIVFITLVAGFAGTIAFPAVHVLSEALGWRSATILIGLGIAVLIAPAQWLAARSLQRGRIPPQRPQNGPTKSYLRRPAFWLLGFGLATLAFIHGAMLNHLLPLLSERGLPLEFAVFIAAMIGPMQVAGRLLMVVLGRYFEHSQFLLSTFALITAAVALLLFSGDARALIVTFVLLYGSAWGVVSILRPLIAREILGQDGFGAKSGSLAMLFLAASAGSSWLGALIWKLGGYDLLLIGLVGLGVIGAVLVVAAHRLAPRG